jgi:hypothetical protein
MLSLYLTGLFLVNNYKQALGIISGEGALMESMKGHGIEDATIFTKWLEEECEHLQGLSREPIQEMLEMEYYQHLVELKEYQYVNIISCLTCELTFNRSNKASDNVGIEGKNSTGRTNHSILWIEPTTGINGLYRAPKGTAAAMQHCHVKEKEA